MDIYQALTKDHNELKPLLAELVRASENDENTKRILDQIGALLIPHARAEEAVFYNPLREFDTAKDKVRHAYGEHMQAETVLRTLRGMATINVEWTALAQKFKDSLEHHIAEEEGEIFDAARAVLLDEEARQMGAAFERMKPEFEGQGMLKDTMDLIANLMPNRFREKFGKSPDATV